MNHRILVAFLPLQILALAGAAPRAQRQYRLHCKMTRHDGTELASPKIDVIEGLSYAFTAGGDYPTARPGFFLDYGIKLEGSVTPAKDGKLIVDAAFSLTTPSVSPDGGVTVAGYTARTICTTTPDKAIRLPLIPAGDATCEITVTPITP
jgi:hypothetical protein